MKILVHSFMILTLALAGARVACAEPVCGIPATQPACACCPAPVTAVLSALDEETRLLEQSLADKQEQKIHGIRFVRGTLAGRHVVLVVSGMGKVNAAVVYDSPDRALPAGGDPLFRASRVA